MNMTNPTKQQFLTKIFGVVLLLCVSAGISAQNCADRIEGARVMYDYGELQEMLDTLKTCDDNVNVHRLRAMAYLGLNQLPQARSEAIALLNIDPLFEPSLLNDPKDFIRLIEGITVIPKLSVGLSISAGTNLTLPEVQKVYSVIENDQKTYSGKQGYSLGFSSVYQINTKWGIYGALQASIQNYGIDYSSSNLSLSMDERLTYGVLPLGVRFSPEVSNWFKPYVYAGAYGELLLGSNSSFYYDDNTLNESFSLEQVSMISQRNRLVYGGNVGLGAVKQVGPGLVSLEVNYKHSLRQINNGDARYDYPAVSQGYYHLDDDFLIHVLSFNVGYSIIFNYQVITQ